MRPLLLALLTTAAVAANSQDVHVRVDPHGPGSTTSTTDFTTIQQALDHAPEAPHGRIFIEIVPGTYAERINVTQNRPRVTLLGLGAKPEDVIITAAQNAQSAGGTFFTETAEINGDNFEADNLTFANTAGLNPGVPGELARGGGAGQAVAAAVRSDRAVFKHVRFLGDQDTLFADFGRQYYLDSYIEGGVDFIFGNATAVFDHSEIHETRNGYLTAQSRTAPDQTTGYVITNSKVTSSAPQPQCEGVDVDCKMRYTFYLGRPWRAYSRVIVMNSELPQDLQLAGWSKWKADDPTPTAFYAEFNNTGPGATTSHRAPWSHQLTAAEASAFTPQTFLRGTNSEAPWNPIAEAARLPDPPVQLSAAEDHQRLLNLLHITALRPGVSHDPTSPAPTNFDESKANPWPDLPDPLTLTNGRKVTTAAAWNNARRPQLLDLFSKNIFGIVPANVPTVTWHVASEDHETVGDTPVLTKHLIGHADNSAYPLLNVDIELTLTTPANAPGPVPVVMEFTFEKYPFPPTFKPPPPPDHPTWKEQVLARGWGYALLYPTTFQADNGAGLTSGIIGLTNHGQPRSVDDWGTLRAWAWGASRALDYFQTDPAVNAKHVAIEGHSRFGKAALVAMAYEPRFAVAYVSSSGAGGASLARRRFGEQLENVAATGEYHWMGANYLRYAETSPQNITPANMPVDTHELIALCAPRHVFIGGGVTEGDGWADTHGAYLAELAASPVYNLLGAHGLEAAPKTTSPDPTNPATYPPVDTALISGDLGYRQQNGGHTPLPNFPTFLTFAARYLNPQP